jgi:hypothetical protein
MKEWVDKKYYKEGDEYVDIKNGIIRGTKIILSDDSGLQRPETSIEDAKDWGESDSEEEDEEVEEDDPHEPCEICGRDGDAGEHDSKIWCIKCYDDEDKKN